jgi:hypothetical protein
VYEKHVPAKAQSAKKSIQESERLNTFASLRETILLEG